MKRHRSPVKSSLRSAAPLPSSLRHQRVPTEEWYVAPPPTAATATANPERPECPSVLVVDCYLKYALCVCPVFPSVWPHFNAFHTFHQLPVLGDTFNATLLVPTFPGTVEPPRPACPAASSTQRVLQETPQGSRHGDWTSPQKGTAGVCRCRAFSQTRRAP